MNINLLFAQILIYVGGGLTVVFLLLGLGMILGILPARASMSTLHLHDTYYIVFPFWLYLVPVVSAAMIFGSGLFMKRGYLEAVIAIEEALENDVAAPEKEG